MGITRRVFLKGGAMSVVGMAAVPAFLARAAMGADAAQPYRRLVVIFQRGAADGLNIVVPHGEAEYYTMRPTIAIPQRDLIDLDGFFGLHPAMSALKPLWDARQLAIVHAAGSPDPTRSHFDAQDFMESGTPGVKSTGDGWMNRVLAVMPGKASPTEALSLGANVPRILSGRMPVANIALGRGAARPLPMDRPIVETAFDRMYRGSDALSHAYQEGRTARAKLMTELEQDMTEANNGAPSPQGFSDDTARLAH